MATPAPVPTETYAQYITELENINEAYHTAVTAEAAKYHAAMAAHTQALTDAFNVMNSARIAAYEKYQAANTY